MAAKPGRRKEPAGWLMRIRAQGPGAMRPPKEERGPARSRRAARKDEREEERPPPPSLNPASRRKVADALKSIKHISPQLSALPPIDTDKVRWRCL